jgi:hypothetical protein
MLQMLKLILCVLLCSICHWGLSQNPDSLPRELSIEIEIRPRAEYRDNYIMSSNDTLVPDFHISQRNRITLNYTGRKISLIASLQEIHLWAKSGVFSSIANINAYELYLQPRLSQNLSFRIGRQGVSLDNGRIFSDAPWAQQGRAHEGIRVMHRGENVSNDLFALATRHYSQNFDERFSPVSAHQYKLLFVHYLKYKPNPHITLTGLNAIDFFEAPASGENYERITLGGRLEAEKGSFYATLNAYYQLGRNAQLKQLNAFYLQPECRMTFGKSIIRIGAEILSGDNSNIPVNSSGSFDVLYGVAWKFMGNMNLFTRFPNDVNGKGLVNPYIFAIHALNKKISVRSDFNFFFNQYPLNSPTGQELNKYLGFENDLSVKYKPNKKWEINYGFSWLIPKEEIGLLRKVRDINKAALWSYLMISYRFNVIDL